MTEIDSFSLASTVDAGRVREISRPLPLREAVVKRIIARIIGEPFVGKDWGGERDDLFTTRVVLSGRSTPTSLILKGPGHKGPLTLAALGKAGDQLERMTHQPADLFVIQHCDEVKPAVRMHLTHFIRSLRSSSNPRAIGSIWDGSDCARLFLAHGFIDPKTGQEVAGWDG